MSNQETMISLQSYAVVLAGLGAGLSLRRALAQADVPAPAWEPASEHWQAQIDASAASDLGLLVAFDGALSTARRRFEPTIEPISSDPQAWAQFRRHFVTAVAPVAFLAERDLSLGTYARLEADWANRLLADEALAAAMQRHMDAPLSECPALTVTRSSWLLDAADAPMELDPTVTAPMPALRPVVASAVLPFIEAAPPVEPAAAPAERASPGPRVDSGQTVVASLAPVAAATPFRPATSREIVRSVASAALSRRLPELSVEQYAWVVAKLRKAAPAEFARTLATLRLTPETRGQLEAHWRARMGRDPELQQAFIAALGRFMKDSGV
jgi:hypothetical protein